MKLFAVTLIFGLALSVSCYQTAQYETGTDNSVHWEPSPIHVLHQGNQVPRSVDVIVKFRNKFVNPPQVATSTSLLDWSYSAPQGYIISVRAVTAESFTIRYTAVAPLQVYSVFVNWFAVYDPRITIGFFESTALGDIMQGEGDRSTSVNVPLEKQFKQAPQAIAFLNGVRVTRRNYLVFVSVGQTTTTSIELKVRTWYISNIAMVRVCLIIGDPAVFWVSPEQAFRVPNGDHPWLKRNPSESAVTHNMDVPREWQNGDRGSLIGFTGFDAEESKNMRVFVRNYQIGTARSSVELGTWWDSQLYQVNYRVMIYRRDPDYRIFDPNCAELFSECNFSGDSVTLCDRIVSLPENGWSKPIRSFTIPDGKSIKLYNQEQLRGQVAVFSKGEQCLDDLTFSLVQLS